MTFAEFPKMLYRGTEHVTVDNADQEKKFIAGGYAPPGKSDPEAVARSLATPDPDFEVIEFPKSLGDAVVANSREEEEAFKAGGISKLREVRQAALTAAARAAKKKAEYPKAVGNRIARNETEEAAIIAAQGAGVGGRV